MNLNLSQRLAQAVDQRDYDAAHLLVRDLLDDLEYLREEGKGLLAQLYRSATPPQRDLIVHGILEHLYEVGDVAGDFADWASDPGLQPAYSSALKWASEVTRCRKFLRPIAELCAQELAKRGHARVEVEADAIGTDSAVVQWVGRGGERQTLVIECGDELKAILARGRPSDASILSLAVQAAEETRWRLDEHVAWQHWVTLG